MTVMVCYGHGIKVNESLSVSVVIAHANQKAILAVSAGIIQIENLKGFNNQRGCGTQLMYDLYVEQQTNLP